MACELGLMDYGAVGLNNALALGVLKHKRSAMLMQNMIELHSAQYKYLAELRSQAMEVIPQRQVVLDVLLASAYPLVALVSSPRTDSDTPQ